MPPGRGPVHSATAASASAPAGASSPWAAGARVPEGDTCGQNAGRRSPAGPAPQGYPTPVAPLRAPSFPHPDQLPPPVPLLPAAFGLVDTRGGGGRGRPGCQGRGRSWLCGLGSRRRGWPGPPSSLRAGHSSSCVVLSHPHPRGCAGPFPAGLSGCSRGAEPQPRTNSGDFVPARHTPVPCAPSPGTTGPQSWAAHQGALDTGAPNPVTPLAWGRAQASSLSSGVGASLWGPGGWGPTVRVSSLGTGWRGQAWPECEAAGGVCHSAAPSAEHVHLIQASSTERAHPGTNRHRGPAETPRVPPSAGGGLGGCASGLGLKGLREIRIKTGERSASGRGAPLGSPGAPGLGEGLCQAPHFLWEVLPSPPDLGQTLTAEPAEDVWGEGGPRVGTRPSGGLGQPLPAPWPGSVTVTSCGAFV